jgi:hypothetical protein
MNFERISFIFENKIKNKIKDVTTEKISNLYIYI